MKSNKFVVLLIAGCLSLAVLAACGGAPAGQRSPEPLKIEITATDIAFDVNQISAAAGHPVKVSLVNHGALVHDYSITAIPLDGDPVVSNGSAAGATDDAADAHAGHDMGSDATGEGGAPTVHVVAAPGTTGTVEFTPAESGTYAYECTVAGHKEAGMIGTLVVH